MRLFHSSQKTSSNSAKPAQDAQAFESAPHLSTPVSYLVNTLLIVIVIAPVSYTHLTLPTKLL